MKYQFKKGFTVLETIIAIAAVSLAIRGAFSAARAGLFSSSLAKEEIQAYYLSQEALEGIKNKIYSNYLFIRNNGGSAWLSGLAGASTDPCYPANLPGGKTCYVDVFVSTPFVACTGSWETCPSLRQDATTYRYGHNNAWSATIFRRGIKIEQSLSNPDEISVTIQIYWTHSGLVKQFTTKTILTRWF